MKKQTGARVPHPGRRKALLAAAGLALGGMPAAAFAQGAWPTPGQPIRIVVTQGPGAGSDILARLIGAELQTALDGHPVVVENRPGAAGMLGHSYVAKAPADGNTLILSSTGLLLVTPEMTTGLRIHYTDYAPVAGLIEGPYVLVVPNTPEAPKSLAELRRQLADGKGTYGSSGAGTMAHLASALVLQRAGLKADHVPYKANTQVLQDLAGGRLSFASDSVSSARGMLQADRVRALAVTSAERLSSLPGVPTLAEAGLPGTVITTRAGLLAPKGVPPERIQRLSEAVRQVLAQPAVAARLVALESPARYASPADYAKELDAEAKVWVGLVKQMNLKPD